MSVVRGEGQLGEDGADEESGSLTWPWPKSLSKPKAPRDGGHGNHVHVCLRLCVYPYKDNYPTQANIYDNKSARMLTPKHTSLLIAQKDIRSAASLSFA